MSSCAENLFLKDSVCAVCQYDWPQDDNFTLLCQSEIECPLEFHTFCLDPPLTHPPEEQRDWLCPACHAVGKTAHLRDYFVIFNDLTFSGQQSKKFHELLESPCIVGNCVRLSTNSAGMHTGRLISRRQTSTGYEHLVQFKSGADGRNLPYSEWICLGSHDCAVATDIIFVKYQDRWCPGEIIELSGIIVPQNKCSVNNKCSDSTSESLWVVLFENDTYVRVSSSDTRPLDCDIGDLDDCYDSIAYKRAIEESHQRDLVRYRLHRSSALNQSVAHHRDDGTLHEITYDIPESCDRYKSIEEYNEWLRFKPYISAGNITDLLRACNALSNDSRSTERIDVALHPSIEYEVRRMHMALRPDAGIQDSSVEAELQLLRTKKVVAVDLDRAMMECGIVTVGNAGMEPNKWKFILGSSSHSASTSSLPLVNFSNYSTFEDTHFQHDDDASSEGDDSAHDIFDSQEDPTVVRLPYSYDNSAGVALVQNGLCSDMLHPGVDGGDEPASGMGDVLVEKASLDDVTSVVLSGSNNPSECVGCDMEDICLDANMPICDGSGPSLALPYEDCNDDNDENNLDVMTHDGLLQVVVPLCAAKDTLSAEYSPAVSRWRQDLLSESFVGVSDMSGSLIGGTEGRQEEVGVCGLTGPEFASICQRAELKMLHPAFDGGDEPASGMGDVLVEKASLDDVTSVVLSGSNNPSECIGCDMEDICLDANMPICDGSTSLPNIHQVANGHDTQKYCFNYTRTQNESTVAPQDHQLCVNYVPTEEGCLEKMLYREEFNQDSRDVTDLAADVPLGHIPFENRRGSLVRAVDGCGVMGEVVEAAKNGYVRVRDPWGTVRSMRTSGLVAFNVFSDFYEVYTGIVEAAVNEIPVSPRESMASHDTSHVSLTIPPNDLDGPTSTSENVPCPSATDDIANFGLEEDNATICVEADTGRYLDVTENSGDNLDSTKEASSLSIMANFHGQAIDENIYPSRSALGLTTTLSSKSDIGMCIEGARETEYLGDLSHRILVIPTCTENGIDTPNSGTASIEDMVSPHSQFLPHSGKRTFDIASQSWGIGESRLLPSYGESEVACDEEPDDDDDDDDDDISRLISKHLTKYNKK